MDFVEPTEARAAYKGLAYRSYKHMPMYLEWAPVNTIDKDKAAAALKALKKRQEEISKTKGGAPGSATTNNKGETGSKKDSKNEGEEYAYKCTFIVCKLIFTVVVDYQFKSFS